MVVVRGESEREVVRDGLELFLEISRLELRTKIVNRDFGLIAKANTLIDVTTLNKVGLPQLYFIACKVRILLLLCIAAMVSTHGKSPRSVCLFIGIFPMT